MSGSPWLRSCRSFSFSCWDAALLCIAKKHLIGLRLPQLVVSEEQARLRTGSIERCVIPMMMLCHGTRRRWGDAPRADQPGEAGRNSRAHGGWAVGGL